jgi:cytidylate kinase
MTVSDRPLIGVVGPCASGKSTLIAALEARGFHTRHIAQEHSYVPDMWQRLTRPDVLIFLDASYTATRQRRALDWSEGDYAEQHRRLAHARQHAHFALDTSELTREQVIERVLAFLAQNPDGK